MLDFLNGGRVSWTGNYFKFPLLLGVSMSVAV
jgi:hypothetical protein